MVFENEIWDFLRTITEGMANAFRPIVEEYGLTLMQTRILVEVKDGAPHTIGSLGSIIGLSSGNASSMCKKLEAAGFLRRIRTPEDERFVKLALTRHGEDTIYRIEEDLERRCGVFLEYKGEQEYQRFIECMENVKAFMQEMYEFQPK
ncbi:transcriptional regulator, MarR family [Desulfitobacterium hafniense DP7]|nr:transcriptional regulator, MarR family [Desulfitobacterium hafniense DP7]